MFTNSVWRQIKSRNNKDYEQKSRDMLSQNLITAGKRRKCLKWSQFPPIW